MKEVCIPFDKLPKEMLLLILGFIPNNEWYKLTEVNREFKDICNTE